MRILAVVMAGLALLALVVVSILVSRRRRAARRLYRRTLESALADGMLTPDEIAELEKIREEKDLTAAEVRMVARTIYRGAIRAAIADHRLTPEEDRQLSTLQSQLGLSEEDMGDQSRSVARLRLLARVEAGDLPSVESPLTLVPHETCHWVVQASLADRLALPRRSRAEPAAVLLSVDGRVPFSAAGPRDPLRPNEEILPVDLGMLVITSRRTIFQGARRTVAVPHARLEAIALYRDGLRLDEQGTDPRVWILVDDAELTAAVLLQAARRRNEEIRPTRTGRSA